MQLGQITIQQARAVNAFSPTSWTISETPDGWVVRHGDATLIASNSRQDRVFASVETAIRRLKAEVGVTEFRVEAMKIAA
jgi:hypothetical protein